MYKSLKLSAIILLGGFGSRFDSALPKQFHNLSGKKIYLHTLDSFYNLNIFDEILLVSNESFLDVIKEDTKNYLNIKIVAGGKTRQESSYLGLKNCSKPEIVVIHDGVRPFVTKKIILDNIDAAILHQAVDTCIKSTDTLVEIKKNKICKIPNRSNFLRGQTPQSFDYDLILNAHKKAFVNNILNSTDDCQLVLKNHPVHVIDGDENNIKITTKLDLFLAEQLFRLKKTTVSKSNLSLENKLFVVVGGTGGIGKEVIKYLKQEKAKVISVSRTSKYQTDIKNYKNVKDTFSQIHKKYGLIDGLINTAGLLLVKSFKSTKNKEIDDLIKVNLLGLIYCCKEAKIKQNGHIINTSSSSYAKGRKNYGIYSASKAAVVNFTQSLAEEYPNLNINAIVPQRLNTPMRSKCFPNEKISNLLNPNKVAEIIVSILKNNDITGTIIEVKK